MKYCFTFFLFGLMNLSIAQVTQISNFPNNNVFGRMNTDEVGVIGNKYIFTANTEEYGTELWSSNGSVSGPKIIEELIEGPSGSSFENFVSTGDKVCFYADAFEGTQLYCTNGSEITLTGYVEGGEVYNTFDDPVALNGELYYAYYTSTNGEELWKTDGSENGAIMLKDITPGSSSSAVNNYFVFKDRVFFFAEQSSFDGFELWVTDGTSSGTTMIKRLDDNGRSNLATALDHDGNVVYFTMQRGFSDDLWISDGTLSGTKYVATLDDPIKELKVINGNAYFILNGGEHAEDIWTSDGTASGTKIVHEFAESVFPRSPFSLTKFESKLYFFAFNDGDMYFTSLDPSTNEVTLIKEFSSSTTSVNQFIIDAGDEMLMVCSEDFSQGYEIFTSKGTSATTELLTDLSPFSSSSYAVDLQVLASGDVIFKGEIEDEDRELFRYKKSNYEPFYGELMPENAISCHDDTVNLIAQGFGGEPPYNYEWSLGNINDSQILNAEAGIYNVTISDNSGDNVALTFEVSFPPELLVEEGNIIPATGSNADGSVSVEAIGGVAPYEYLWEDGTSGQLLENIASGSYIVTVTDSLGCKIEEEFMVPMVSNTNDLVHTLRVYPTVARDVLFVNNDNLEHLKVVITNSVGHRVIVLEGAIDKIDVQHLLPGNFVVQIINQGELIKTERFVKI